MKWEWWTCSRAVIAVCYVPKIMLF